MQLFYFAALISFLAAIPSDGKGDFNAHGDIAGNTINAPVHAPHNSCSNGVKVIGGSNTAFDNSCTNTAVEADTDAHNGSNNSS
jgi:hypothetical protein